MADEMIDADISEAETEIAEKVAAELEKEEPSIWGQKSDIDWLGPADIDFLGPATKVREYEDMLVGEGEYEEDTADLELE